MSETALVLMSWLEARACVEAIHASLENVRARLAELHEREGWRSLGYASWERFLTVEFQMSARQAGRLLTAHAVDLILAIPSPEGPLGPSGLAVAQIPESHARELEPLLDRPAELLAAYAEAGDGQPRGPTAAGIRAAVERRVLGPEEQLRLAGMDESGSLQTWIDTQASAAP